MRGAYIFHEIVPHERSLHEKCLLDVQQNIILFLFSCLISPNKNKLEIRQAFLAIADVLKWPPILHGFGVYSFNFQVLEEFTNLDLVYSHGP